MFLFLNILSCIACCYMFNKAHTLQRRVDLLHYEMVMLSTYIYTDKTKNLIKYKDE